jgi:hemerythrin
MQLEWTRDLQVGVDDIDAQHRELFARINKLRSAMATGKGKDEVNSTLIFLEEYVVEHFSNEERYMRELNYCYFEPHKTEHENFIRDFGAIKEKLQKLEHDGGITAFVAIEAQRKLVDWLVNHIGKSDKVLGAYLAAQR